ncbi:MAG: histidine kinase [Cyclobacteriaceae bacterium]
MNQLVTKKHFYSLNMASLVVIGTILFLKAIPTVSLAAGLGPLLAVYLISTFAFYLTQFTYRRTHHVLLIIGSIIFYWLLATFFIIILERFFRIEERFTLLQYREFLLENWTFTMDAMLWVVGYSAILYIIRISDRLRATELKTINLEKELYQSDLNTLRKEINPHFLFNAMNGIAMKVRLKENKTAVSMIAALNDLLRLSLKKGDEKLITVAEEVGLLQKYLLIESHRFGDATRIDIRIDETIYQEQIPELILQPLVENAFKYGGVQIQETLIVRVTGERTSDGLVFSVYNSISNGITVNFSNQGVGLPNVVHRLRRIYGTQFRFQSFQDEAGIVFRIRIPEVG